LEAEDAKAGEGFGEGEEAGAEAHCYCCGVGFDSFVGDV
jgi:hypothetical protein